MGLFDSLDAMEEKVIDTREHIIKAPFAYPGGKSRSIKYILPHLPVTGRYVEVFGGSGTILLNRKPSEFEVYNDRYGGVVDFYRCIQNKLMMEQMIDFLDKTLKSREMFAISTDECITSTNPVERAAWWYYSIQQSFASLGRNFGRDLKATKNMIDARFPLFRETHKRMKNVLIENLDWSVCLKDFDSIDTVFYLDPPYLNSTVSGNLYEHGMKAKDHHRLCQMIFEAKGHVALSGYENPIYMTFPWDDIITWDVAISMTGLSFTETSNREGMENQIVRGHRAERLYVKYAQG